MRNSSSWRRACAGASLTALVFGGLALAPAGAQAPPPAAADSSPPELVVTATRVDRKGFVAPTPTTVLSEKDILVGSPNNLVDVISNLPQGTAAWSATAEPGSVVAGASFVDLRDLGPNRTLVLIDGARPVATEFTGTTLGFDMNMVPIALVKKVDVVTGGASASWGSDAVAGVVNIVMDDGFTGFKGDAQYGGSTEGFGGDEIKVDVAGGMNFAGGAGHVMAGFGYDDRDAIAPRTLTSPGQYGLISNPAYTKTNGQTQDIFVKDPLYSTTSTGGLITSGPLKGTDFGPGGSVGTFLYGADAGSSMAGGDPTAYNYNFGEQLVEPLKRENLYGRATYDLNATTVLTADLLLGHTQTAEPFFPYVALGNLTISRNNAYLPAQIYNEMVADNINSFSFGRVFAEDGDIVDKEEAYTEQLTLGAHGKVFDTWTWDTFASYGATERSINFVNSPITANLNNAVNAIKSPTTGQPICAIALTNPATNCVPVDLFGQGSISQAAHAYFTGASTMKMDLTQAELAANLRGSPFSTWAGPVSVAVGAEFRDEAVTAHTDAITAAGGFAFYNASTLSDGAYTVGEGYIESVVPLARSLPLLQALDFDGGVRVSDYSTNGSVPSWKLGLTDQVTDEIRLRGAYSRDIRAPNLAELFLKRSTSIGTVTDPTNNSSVQIPTYGGGNQSLQPELADTQTLGIVYSPNWLKRLSMSVDYYNIVIDQAISTLSAQTIINECYSGSTGVCGQIVRVNGVISYVNATEINIASYKLSGFDFEADYATDLSALNVPGRLSLRLLATYIDTFKENTGSSIINLAGDTSNGSPRVKGSLTGFYTLGPWEAMARWRYVEGGAYSKQVTVNVTVPDANYFDLGIQRTVPSHDNYTLFANIENVGNSLNPRNQAATYYDVLGRTFNVGLRVRY